MEITGAIFASGAICGFLRELLIGTPPFAKMVKDDLASVVDFHYTCMPQLAEFPTVASELRTTAADVPADDTHRHSSHTGSLHHPPLASLSLQASTGARSSASEGGSSPHTPFVGRPFATDAARPAALNGT